MPEQETTPRPRRIRGLDADQRRQQRRDALLAAGLDLFARQGFAHTSIEQLCQHAFVGTKAFYETFDSRDSLYSALLQQLTDAALARLAAVADGDGHGDGDRGDVSDRLLEEFAHVFVDDVRVAKVTFGASAAITPAAERQRRGNRRVAAAFVESIWQRDVLELDDRHHDIAIGVIGGLFDIVADWVLDLAADEPDSDEVALLIQRLKNFYGAVSGGMSSM